MNLSKIEWFKLIANLGPAAAAIWAQILIMFNAAKTIADEVKKYIPAAEQSPDDGGLALTVLTPEEEAAQGEAVAALTTGNESFDPTILLTVWQFLQAHPQLAAGIVSLLGGLLKRKA